jgi:hypothetical protein
MHALTRFSLIGLAASSAAAFAADERNLWPLTVVQERPAANGKPAEWWNAAGPFLFSEPVAPERFNGATRASGLRPLYLRLSDEESTREAHLLYPFFTFRRMTDGYRWSVFQIINNYSQQSTPESATQRGFDVWPFYYSRETGSPETSYHAVLPIYGTVKHRFGMDRLSWVGFPFYAKWEKNNVATYTTPWPIIKTLTGEGNHGFEIWPLFGIRGKEGAYRDQFYLWPLIYKRETQLWEAQPDLKAGFLPFYTTARNAESRSDSFLLFWGYSDRTAPYRYHQNNYFWPFWVQGRGDQRYINRWGPFYTHSNIKGTEKTWIAWPFWKELTWSDDRLTHTRRSFLFFLYNDTEQRSVSNSSLPAAHKTHYWPFLSVWDNGAGRKQVQAFSPLEVFFPSNENIRLEYTPLFAIYRYSRDAEQTRYSFLWNLVTYRRDAEEREFHVGPLFSSKKTEAGKRYAIGNGLVSFQRSADTGRWRLGFFDFKRRAEKAPVNPPAP